MRVRADVAISGSNSTIQQRRPRAALSARRAAITAAIPRVLTAASAVDCMRQYGACDRDRMQTFLLAGLIEPSGNRMFRRRRKWKTRRRTRFLLRMIDDSAGDTDDLLDFAVVRLQLLVVDRPIGDIGALDSTEFG